MRFIVGIVAIPLVLGTAALASDCSDTSTQTEMNTCAADAFQKADAALNSRYKEISRRLADSPEARKALVTAQRAWIQYRDAECAFRASGVAGGSIAPMIEAQCLGTLTDARLADFEAMLSCEEGDLSCPVPPR